jgi:hypothetical protein
MLHQYRFISARNLLALDKLDFCQSLPQKIWTPRTDLWHMVFLSHRWISQDDPDPFGKQLAALKQLIYRVVDITKIITDEKIGQQAVQERISIIPSLVSQGTLQAAHLVFRTLCYGEEMEIINQQKISNDGILDLIGFWYDYCCLPQDPKTIEEAQEFSNALQNIQEMIISPHVSTLVLRHEDDEYLSRGWCFAESLIANSKSDVCMPMVLRTDQWGQSLSLFESQPFAVFKPAIEQSITRWQDINEEATSYEIFLAVINATALPLLMKSEPTTSVFALALDETVNIGVGIMARAMSYLVLIQEGKTIDLALCLSSLLQSYGLGCRDERDYILVSLFLLKSLVSEDATGDVAIWRDALARFTEGLSLQVTRHNGTLTWS